MAVCNRCSGKGIIKTIVGLDPTRCPVCFGTGWPKTRSPSRDKPPVPKYDTTISVHDDDADIWAIIDDLPQGESTWDQPS